MNSIPQCYPVTVSFRGDGERLAVSGMLPELVQLQHTRMLESGGGYAYLHVVARNPATARIRAESATRCTVVEVGEPSPLQHFSSQKALPHRRSFVMSRFKRGRFSQQGGAGAHTPAVAASNTGVQNSGAGLSVGESVVALLGRKPEDKEMEQARRSPPKVKESTTTKRESVDKPSLDSLLRGYPKATALHLMLSKTPQVWRESTRGRKVIVDGIYDVRMAEGSGPADCLESAYLNDDLGALPIHEGIRQDLFAVKSYQSVDGNKAAWVTILVTRSKQRAFQAASYEDAMKFDYPLMKSKVVHPDDKTVQAYLAVGNSIEESSDPNASRRRSIEVTFQDGNVIRTDINGTEDEIRRHYIGNYFNFGDTDENPKDNMQKAVKVKFLD